MSNGTDRTCSLEANLESCTCSYSGCVRKGRCCECLTYHWRNRQLPGCLFPPDIERTYDRSVERFVQVYGGGGAR